jgi:hypothetical protein
MLVVASVSRAILNADYNYTVHRYRIGRGEGGAPTAGATSVASSKEAQKCKSVNHPQSVASSACNCQASAWKPTLRNLIK